MNDTNPLNNNIPNQQSVVNPSVNVMPSENAQAAPANDVAGQQVASTNINTPQTNNSPEQIVPSSTPNNVKKQNKVEDGSGGNAVVKRDIENVVASWTGIPISKLTEDESAKLLELEKRVHKRLIDQEEAVVKVSEAVRRGRIGLASGQRPIASFIFLGPSGTGKTELAKTLAEILFGRDDSMIRLDMSEYMEKHEVAKLIGAPPGYVGYEEGGQLTEAVRAKPYSIVLLDEVEKAHPDVFNILLQLLEDGRLTDNKGNTISFKNTIIICTSNIGSALITEKLKDSDTKTQKTTTEYTKEFNELSSVINNELRKFFRPELLNRFDDIVIFKPLRREDMVGIAKLGIEKTAKLLIEQGYTMSITDRALSKLAREGYDPMYGARPLRRLIQNSIENPIALEIIGKKFIPGDTIAIDYKGDTNVFSFSKSERSADVAVGGSVATNLSGASEIPVGSASNIQAGQTSTLIDSTQGQTIQTPTMYYGQQIPQPNSLDGVAQAPTISPVANFDPLSVLGSENQSSEPAISGIAPVYQPPPPSAGAFVSGGADTIVNTNNFQQGAANVNFSQDVLAEGQLTSSGLEVLNEEL